jgi:DNA-binding transcriptional MerR regulator
MSDVISKKDLLELTDITYGQLYRWKRMGLIPEAWFARKPTFTGQETFLPRDKALERIRQILQLKDKHSLEELADILSPESSNPTVELDHASPAAQPNAGARTIYDAIRPEAGPYRFADAWCMAVLEQLLAREHINRDQVVLAARTLAPEAIRPEAHLETARLVVACRFGLSFVCISQGACRFDPDTRVICEIHLGQVLENVKQRMGHHE